MAKNKNRKKGARTDEPSFNTRESELLENEQENHDAHSRVAVWPLDDEPLLIVYGRIEPHRYWTALVENDRRLPEPFTDAAARLLRRALTEAEGFRLNSQHLPGPYWRWATRQERRESILLAYQLQHRESAYRSGRIRPPVTKDRERIERREREKQRIAAAVRGDLPIPEGSRLERIVAAHRLYESTAGEIDIRDEITRREMPDEDEEAREHN